MVRHRRGGAYILVLGVALLVTVIGMGALMTTRLAAREANSSTDWEEAGTLAQAGGDILTTGTIMLGAGPISTNGKLTTSAVITGSTESVNQAGSSSNVSGTMTVSAAMAKTMPSAGMYNLYLSKATAIPWSSIPS